MGRTGWTRMGMVAILLGWAGFCPAVRAADAPAVPSAPAATADALKAPDSPPLEISFGTGVSVQNREAGLAFTGRVGTRVREDLPLFGGGEVVVTRWSTYRAWGGRQSVAGATGIHLLGGLWYRTPVSPGVEPYLGVSGGFHILAPDSRDAVTWNGTGDVATEVDTLTFAIFLRSGVAFELTERLRLAAETRVGISNFDPFVLPQIVGSLDL